MLYRRGHKVLRMEEVRMLQKGTLFKHYLPAGTNLCYNQAIIEEKGVFL